MTMKCRGWQDAGAQPLGSGQYNLNHYHRCRSYYCWDFTLVNQQVIVTNRVVWTSGPVLVLAGNKLSGHDCSRPWMGGLSFERLTQHQSTKSWRISVRSPHKAWFWPWTVLGGFCPELTKLGAGKMSFAALSLDLNESRYRQSLKATVWCLWWHSHGV